ncbi:CBO0543 family protein [Wukongibacter baidiensis]|uniref:CBO0543 family protein n=1 Tax=Wukongibacter baidiensis TaxID=1723361 RepID=UPI003D7F4CF3
MLDTFNDILKLHKKLANLEHQYWKDHVVFSLNWWILLITFILPWLIWWKICDKKQIKELLLYGSFIMIVGSTFDDLGRALSLWAYPYELVQVADRLNSVDFSALPVCYMVIYQFFPKWKSFAISNLIFSLCCAFILEPFLVWLGIYRTLTWKYIYSFPIYFAIAIIGKLIISKLNKISRFG